MNTTIKTLFTSLSIGAALSFLPATSAANQQPEFAIAIHGGAGTINREKMTPEKRKQYENDIFKFYNFFTILFNLCIFSYQNIKSKTKFDIRNTTVM